MNFEKEPQEAENHTNPDIFETAYFFIRIGLPSTRNQ